MLTMQDGVTTEQSARMRGSRHPYYVDNIAGDRQPLTASGDVP
jgi:hypothetical protein